MNLRGSTTSTISMWIRENCLFTVHLTTWFSINELIVPFHGQL